VQPQPPQSGFEPASQTIRGIREALQRSQCQAPGDRADMWGPWRRTRLLAPRNAEPLMPHSIQGSAVSLQSTATCSVNSRGLPGSVQAVLQEMALSEQCELNADIFTRPANPPTRAFQQMSSCFAARHSALPCPCIECQLDSGFGCPHKLIYPTTPSLDL
jgi:hypothetical protein